jgi:hypothetical protein
MPSRAPIFPDRIRKIRGSFSWIEHRFLHDGFLRALSRDELLLYYFLVTVGDRNGVSYYDYEKICQLLKLEVEAYIRARDGLSARQLIAYQQGVFQVLPLPARHSPSRPTSQVPARDGDFHALAEIFKRLEEVS